MRAFYVAQKEVRSMLAVKHGAALEKSCEIKYGMTTEILRCTVQTVLLIQELLKISEICSKVRITQ